MAVAGVLLCRGSRLRLWLAGGALALLVCSWAQAQTSGAHPAAPHRLLIGGDSNFPPFEYLDARGRPAGYNVELTRALARELGLEVEIRLGPWDRVCQDLREGRLDALEGLFYSPARDRLYDFSPRHAVVSYVAVVRKGWQSPPASERGLRGKRLVVQYGDIGHDYALSHRLRERLATVPTQEQALTGVAEGRYDCALVARRAALYWIGRRGLRNLAVGRTPLLALDYCYATREGDRRTLDLLNEGLERAVASGEYRRLHEAWLGSDGPPVAPRAVGRYAALVAGPLLLVLLLSLLWSWSLRRQVAARTRQLSESERLLEGVVEGIVVPVFYKNRDGAYVAVNSAFCRFTGKAREELLGRTVEALSAPEHAALFEARDRQLLETGETQVYESCFGLDSTRRVVSYKAPFRDANGAIGGIVGVLIDVTEQRAAEDALRRNEQRFRQLVEISPEAIVVYRRDGRIVFANAAAVQLLGADCPEQLVGRSALEFVPPGERAGVGEYQRHLAAGGAPVLGAESTLLRLDGSEVSVEVAAALVQYDGEDAILTFARDIGARKAAHEAVERSEQRFRQLVEGSPDAIMVGAGGRIVFANQAAARLHGLTHLEELLGRDALEFIAPEQHERVRAHQRLVSSGSGPAPPLEILLRRTDGVEVPVEASALPVLFEGTRSQLVILRDISARRVAEAALESSERRLRLLVETSPEAIVVHTRDNRIRFVNQAAVRLLGARAPDELLGQFIMDWVHPDDCARVLEHQHRVASEPSPIPSLEVTWRRPDGSEVAVDVSAVPLHYEGEDSILLFVRDITERKAASEALQESERRFRLLVEHSPDAIVVHTANRIVYVNQATLRLHRADRPEQMLGRHVATWVRPDQLEAVRTHQEQIDHGPGLPPSIELVLRRFDGTEVPVEVAAVPLQFGGADSTLLFVRDLTERKQAEDALRQFKTIFDIGNFGVVVTGLDYRITYINDYLAARHGYTADELLGQHIRTLHNDEQNEHNRGYVRRLHEGHQCDAEELWHTHRDGTVFPMLTTTTLVRNAEGAPVAMASTSLDLTERRALEHQLQQVQKLEAVGQLAGGVAHDFNNMLSVILGHAQVALLRTEASSPIHASLTEIQRTAKRSAELTQQLLAFARRQTISPRPLDLSLVIEGALQMLRRLIGEEIDLVWLPAPNLALVRMDPSQVEQILTNLCVNARDAIGQVGTITIETRNVSLDESYCADRPGFTPGDYVLLAVSDDGCGMDRDTLERIFEPFFTTKEVSRGTGLGLATVYGIVKQNSGFANVYSEPGSGSTFKIYLPQEAAAPPAPEILGERGPLGQGETILFVEDDASILEVGTILLRELGYQVLAAPRPSEALRLAAEHHEHIDLLMTDVVMPEMNGRELAEKLQQRYPGLRCLFMSGYTANVIADRGVLNEGVHFIHKPFELDEVARAVRLVLSTPAEGA